MMRILIKTTVAHLSYFLHKCSRCCSVAHSIGVATIVIASRQRIVIRMCYPDWRRLDWNGADVGDGGFGDAEGRFGLT